MDIPSPSFDTNSLLASFGKFALLLIAMVIAAVWGGYVLSILWGWFVVPLPFHLPPLTTNGAIGVSAVSGYLLRGAINLKQDEETSWGKTIWMAAFMPAWFLFAGWLLHLLFPITS